MSPTDPPPWTLVLPVKGGPRAKSRLAGPSHAGATSPAGATGLAEAIALDTLDAVLACARVGRTVVVTADADLAAHAGALGAEVCAESRPGAGLDAAVRDGLRAGGGVRGTGGPVAVLLADLPALRPEDLDAALAALEVVLVPASPADRPWAFVPDADGSGTVLLAALDPIALDPAFGPGSAAAHEDRGAVRVVLDAPRLRGDVDTAADLDRARALGLGPRTRAADARRLCLS